MYVDTDKENCERYRQNDRENQQYNRTFRLAHTNSNLFFVFQILCMNCQNNEKNNT